MKKITILNIVVFVFLTFSQLVNSQIVISRPNLGFSQACASPSFNTYNVSFSFNPEASLGASNQFIIELSNSDGSFADAQVIYTTAAGSVTSSPATLRKFLNIDMNVSYD